jgi:hypothetical protein
LAILASTLDGGRENSLTRVGTGSGAWWAVDPPGTYHPRMLLAPESLVRFLVDEGQRLLDQPYQRSDFAFESAADDLINDIDDCPQAFALSAYP